MRTITVAGSHMQTLSWAPDMQHFYATNFNDLDHTFEIIRINLDGKSQSLFKAPLDQSWLANPIPSPDGRYLAFQQRSFDTSVTLLENY